MNPVRFTALCCTAFAALASASHGAPLIQSVAVTLAEDGGAYYDQVVAGAEQAARGANPQVLFTARSCRNNAERQMAQIDGFIKDGVDLILIQRSYRGDSSPAVQRARQAGITVVAIDADVPGGTDALVKPDEEQGGVLAARFLAEALHGKGKVAIADGPKGAAALQLRVAGFTEELSKSPGITLVADVDTGMTNPGTRAAIGRVLTEHPDLDAVFGVNDPVAYYAELEAVAQKRSHLVIVGMEGSPASVEAMRNPFRLIAASPGEDPYRLAAAAVRVGAEIRAGTEKTGEVMLVPFTPVTRANVGEFEGWTH